MKPSEKLASLNLTLPQMAAPIGAYVPGLRAGDWVMCSGQLPFQDGKLPVTGSVPDAVSIEQAALMARIAMLNALSACASAAGGLDKMIRILKVTVYVNSAAGFADQPKVANGASHLLTDIFGEAGRHVRSAVGASSLPMNSPVEVELTASLV